MIGFREEIGGDNWGEAISAKRLQDNTDFLMTKSLVLKSLGVERWVGQQRQTDSLSKTLIGEGEMVLFRPR